MPGKNRLPWAPRPEAASLAALREDYFSFLARQFPTLCLHDEFLFFPRLSAAWDQWFRGAHLEEAVLGAACSRLTEFLTRLEQLPPRAESREDTGEAVLLGQSLRSVLRELGPGGAWEWDPFLYLKAASLAWAPVLARAPHLDWHHREKVAELLAQVARLFKWARRQVRLLSRPAQLLSPGAFGDARRFFTQVLPAFLFNHFSQAAALKGLLKEVLAGLDLFQEAVTAVPAAAPFARGEAGLTEILTLGWGWRGDLDAAVALLEEEVRESRAALEKLAGQLHLGLSWPGVLAREAAPPASVDLLTLYRREVAQLWRFWQNSGLLPPLKGRVEVVETPVYLQSLRSSASYAAPWGPPEEHPGFFYVTPEIEDWAHHLRHYRFLSAHETVPGHHLLDATRLTLAAPVARQYESPLFYEGWACYAETLLLSAGYLHDPQEHLVGWQRRLWRALRGQADLELQRGSLDLEGALNYLRQAGYPEATARLQVLHLALNPGYQLCYTLGLKELLRLKARFAPTLGLARFHEVVLSGGQLPFDRVEANLQAGPGDLACK